MNIVKIENLLKENIYNLEKDDYNNEYNAFTFKTKTRDYRFRSAKITPKKSGAFVVMWKKNNNNVNIPFSYESFPDYLIVEVIENECEGYFIFPKNVLKCKSILTTESTNGKMGFRVYAPWVSELNKTAVKSKKWQERYFYKVTY